MAGVSRVQVVDAAAQGRWNRYPQHTFQVRHRPFEITPFLIAPVLPGETMKNLMIQARAYTDPIKAPAVGWWLEYYVFYVKHRDLDDRTTLTAIMLDPDTSVEALQIAATDTWKYTTDDTIDWTGMCLKRVVEEYFRDEGEAWNTYTITANRPAAQVAQRTWLDSVLDNTLVASASDEELLDISAGTAGGGDDKLMASEVHEALRRWEFERANQLTTMTYEDFLATYGVRQGRLEDHRPELIRYIREWQYPSNTIDPTNGTPRSAVSWVIAETASKPRFFSEPGFIFGVTLARPKVYLQGQEGSAVGLLRNAYAWLPAIMQDDPATSLVVTANSEGPLQSTTNPYLTDTRDLFMYGDQFINFALTEADANIISLPNAALTNKRYPASADADELFVAASPANQVRQDGVVRLTVAGRQKDYTPTM